jgi:enoyl-CoA hydratase/carnithine racemase
MLWLEREGPVARLTIDRPARRNAFDLAMWQALPGLVAEAEADPALRVLVLGAAASGPFCAGADIAEMAANRGDTAWYAANQAAINAAQFALTRCALPTIAPIGGDCIGGGLGLALACDIRIAGPGARFGVTPAKLGIVYPLHDTALLAALIGPGQAARLLFSGMLIGAEEARRIGLVETLEDDAEAAGRALAASIAANAATSLKGLKRLLRKARDGRIEDDAESLALFAAAFAGPDFAERSAAFVARRKPG